MLCINHMWKNDLISILKDKDQIKLLAFNKKKTVLNIIFPRSFPPSVCLLISGSSSNEASQVDYGVKLPQRPSEARLWTGLASFLGKLVSNTRPALGDKTQSRMGWILSPMFAPEYYKLRMRLFSKCLWATDFLSNAVYYAYLESHNVLRRTGKLDQLIGYQACLRHSRQVFILLIRVVISSEFLRTQCRENPLSFIQLSFIQH